MGYCPHILLCIWFSGQYISFDCRGGFWEVYENNKDNILHHVLKLHEGKYITRKSLLDLREAGELANLEKKWGNVGDRINSLYEEKSIREALKHEDSRKLEIAP